jgi:hypothetical protein
MKNVKTCRCQGMNEYCIICDGKGYVPLPGYEKINGEVNRAELEREEEELRKYSQPKQEEVEQEYRPEVYRKKKKGLLPTLIAIPGDDYLNYIGPNNPNKRKLGDTRLLGEKHKPFSMRKQIRRPRGR